MFYMDAEKKQRLQSLKVIISETIMVLAVIISVAVLALIVSGYWIGSGFKVERQGMLQISSMPTGADISIDGDSSWLQRTNTSKVLLSGEHSIVLTKEGYDSWSKTINIQEGLLYRLHYPRLFLRIVLPKNWLASTALRQLSFRQIAARCLLLIKPLNGSFWTYAKNRFPLLQSMSPKFFLVLA